MDLMDRYLQMVGYFLPPARRADVLAELRANMSDELDEMTAGRGRPLTEAELADFLRAQGHPVAVAARYYQVPFVIGAPWTAVYWRVLQMSLIVSLAVTLVRALAGLAVRQNISASLATVFSYPNVALMVFAWVTLVFAVFDYSSRRYHLFNGATWDPGKLPSLDLSGFQPDFSRQPISRLVGYFSALVGVIATIKFVAVLPFDATQYLQHAAGWHLVCTLLVAPAAFNVVYGFACMLRPQWQQGRPLLELIASAAAFAGTIVLMRENIALSPTGPAAHGALGAGMLYLAATIWCVSIATLMASVYWVIRCAMWWRSSQGTRVAA